MAVNRPNGHNIYQQLSLQGIPKIYPNWIFLFWKQMHVPSGNPGQLSTNRSECIEYNRRFSAQPTKPLWSVKKGKKS
jgi:hypothetical protein